MTVPFIANEHGYSVLEVTVALALFVTVLVPAIGGTLRIMTQGSAGTEIEALTHAQWVMEETLRNRTFWERRWLSDDGRWAFQRVLSSADDRVTIEVRVWRARGTAGLDAVTNQDPLVQLVTTRLNDGDGTHEESSLFRNRSTPAW